MYDLLFTTIDFYCPRYEIKLFRYSGSRPSPEDAPLDRGFAEGVFECQDLEGEGLLERLDLLVVVFPATGEPAVELLDVSEGRLAFVGGVGDPEELVLGEIAVLIEERAETLTVLEDEVSPCRAL